MATKNIVPNADGEGQLGTSSKSWAQGHIDSITGTIATAAQANITSLGTLTSLTLSGNLVIPNDGTIGSVGTAGALTISSGGNVKIGNGSTATPSTNADDLFIDNGAAESGITILSTAASSLRFGDASNVDIGSIEYNHNSDYMRMIVNNAEAMRITSGNVGIGTDSPVNLSSQTSLTIQGTSISRLDLKGASGAGGGVIFGSATAFTVQGNYGVPLTLDAGTGANMLFNIGGSNKLTISSGGAANFVSDVYQRSTLLTTDGTTANYRWQTYNNASDDAYVINSRNIGDVFKIGYTTGEVTITSTFASNTFPFRVNTSSGTNIFKIADTGATAIRMNPTSTLASLTLEKLSNSVAINDTIGYLNFFSNDASTTSTGGVGGIAVKAETSFNTASTPSYMSFYTHQSNGNDGTNIGNVTERMRITSGGEVLIGKTAANNDDVGIWLNNDGASWVTQSDTYCLGLNRKGSDGTIVLFTNDQATAGTISVSGTTTAYNTSSDYRLKENVTPITDALSRVNQLKPSRFNFIADADKIVDGFLAHEVQYIVPEAISGEKDAMKDEEFELTPRVDEVIDEEGNVITEAVEAVMETRSVPNYQGIDQSKIVPLLTAAIQEQQTIIEDLKARIETLEG